MTFKILFMMVSITMIKKFNEKLIILLMLELCFLLTMVDMVTNCLSMSFFTFSMMIIMLLMVMESVLGISLLISSSRNSSKISKMLSSF